MQGGDGQKGAVGHARDVPQAPPNVFLHTPHREGQGLFDPVRQRHQPGQTAARLDGRDPVLRSLSALEGAAQEGLGLVEPAEAGRGVASRPVAPGTKAVVPQEFHEGQGGVEQRPGVLGVTLDGPGLHERVLDVQETVGIGVVLQDLERRLGSPGMGYRISPARDGVAPQMGRIRPRGGPSMLLRHESGPLGIGTTESAESKERDRYVVRAQDDDQGLARARAVGCVDCRKLVERSAHDVVPVVRVLQQTAGQGDQLLPIRVGSTVPGHEQPGQVRVGREGQERAKTRSLRPRPERGTR